MASRWLAIAVTYGASVGRVGNDDLADEIASAVKQHITENFPKGIHVRTGVSDDEAVRDIQQQLEDTLSSA